jgi:hypothetical protein
MLERAIQGPDQASPDHAELGRASSAVPLSGGLSADAECPTDGSPVGSEATKDADLVVDRLLGRVSRGRKLGETACVDPRPGTSWS